MVAFMCSRLTSVWWVGCPLVAVVAPQAMLLRVVLHSTCWCGRRVVRRARNGVVGMMFSPRAFDRLSMQVSCSVNVL